MAGTGATRSYRTYTAFSSKQISPRPRVQSLSSRTGPAVQDLPIPAMFPPKKSLRSRLARSLRGSLRGASKPAEAPSGDLRARLFPEAGADFAESKVLSTVVEEDPTALEDWVDDFEPISLEDVRFDEDEDRSSSTVTVQAARSAIDKAPAPAPDSAPVPDPLVLAPSVSQVSDPFATPSDYRSPSSSVFTPTFPSRTSSVQRAFVDKTSPVLSRPRTTSRSSKRSRRSANYENALQDLKIISDFPLPPSHVPTPVSATAAPKTSATPIADNSSVFFDRDPFRAESTLDDDEPSSLNKAELTPVDSSVSFHTAQSRASSPVRPPTPPEPPKPLPEPPSGTEAEARTLSPSPPPVPSRASVQSIPQAPSISARSTNTVTKATATLKRFGSLTKETLRSSFRTPISQISSGRQRKKRVEHVFGQDPPERSVQQQIPFLLPEFKPEALDISFPSFDAATSPRTSRTFHPYPQRSVQSFYGSLEDFLTGHTKQPETGRHHRHRSVPSLLPSAIAADPKRTLESDEVSRPPPSPAPAPPAPRLRPPPPTRPLPPLPPLPPPTISRPFKFEFVDPSELTASPTYSTNEFRYSSAAASLAPPSPSWLSRNVQELEWALFHPESKPSSPTSISSELGEPVPDIHTDIDADDTSSVPYPTSSEAQTPASPSPLPIPSTLPLPYPPSEVVYIRGRVAIHDLSSSDATFRTVASFTDSPSEVTATLKVPRRSRRTSSTASTRQSDRSPTRAFSPSVHSRSRKSSVTRATITHFRRSVVKDRHKALALSQVTRTPSQKENQRPKRSAPSLFPVPSSQGSITTPTPSDLLTPLELVSPASTTFESIPTPVLPVPPRPLPPSSGRPRRPRIIWGKGTDTVDFGGEPDYSNYEWFKDPPPPRQEPPPSAPMGEPYVPQAGVIEQNEMFEYALTAAPNVLFGRFKQYGQLGVLAWCAEFSEMIDALKTLGFEGNMFVTTRTAALRACEEILKLQLDIKMQIIVLHLSSQVARLRRFLDADRVWDDYPQTNFPTDPRAYTS
ncbi:hypothetical protein EVG20_g593 [Dentipellis fragilis]|uniref:Uncharacterized protein n=1 Tax=Dentipellis fragilis TaxID=205917 RepID=A0A4Y9ZEK8_9AGAM|nr:hypothetical protein EVG20_g593 [Dentipellis fragilis]